MKRILLSTLILSYALTLIGLHAQAQSLNDILDADGRILPGSTYNGNLDAGEWSLSLDPDGSPRFHQRSIFRTDELQGTAASVAAPPMHPDDMYWDPVFGSSGVVGAIYTIAVSGCNDVYVGGQFSGIGGIEARNIARWDGAVWHSLGEGGENGTSGPVYAIAVDANDDIYIGGRFDRAGSLTVNNIARWNGSEWSGLENGVDAYDEWDLPTPGTVRAIAIDGVNIYVGGRFDTVGTATGTVAANNVARFDGTTWRTMEGGLVGDGSGAPADRGEIHTIAVGVSGIYVGGRFVRSGGTNLNGLAHWNGLIWSEVGGGLQATTGRVEVFALDINGPDIYVGGRFDKVGNTDARNIAVWASRLNQWFTFGQGSGMPVRSLDVYGTNIYASGNFPATGGGTKRNNIAFWDGSEWQPLGRPQNNGTDSTVHAIAISSTNVYVGGVFGAAGPATAGGIAIWDIATQNWKPLNKNASSGGGVIGAVYALALTPDFLYVGGRFNTAGLVKTNSLARWNRHTRVWSALGGGVAIDPAISTTILPFVRAIAVDGENIYVGGRFDFAGGVRANNVAKWDGVTWRTLGDGIGPNAQGGAYDSTSVVYALAVKDGILYAGGEFILAGNERANRIAKWEEGTQKWSALGGGIGGASFNTRVNAVAIGNDGVYVGGVFPVAGDVRASNIARFDGTSWHALGKGINNSVLALAVDANGNLYAGGDFSTAGTIEVENVARWDGTAWYAMAEGFNLPVRGLAAGPQGVYATGDFLFSAAENTSRVGRWNGSYWEGLGSGLTNQVGKPSGMAVAVEGDDVFFGGSFTIAGGESSLNLAKWSKPTNGIVFPPFGDSRSVASVEEENEGKNVLLELEPNPVVSSGMFRLHLPNGGEVRLTLLDGMGREVRHIHDGPLSAGENTIAWSSQELPNGVYFYRLTGEGIDRSGRIVVQR